MTFFSFVLADPPIMDFAFFIVLFKRVDLILDSDISWKWQTSMHNSPAWPQKAREVFLPGYHLKFLPSSPENMANVASIEHIVNITDQMEHFQNALISGHSF